MSYFCDTCDKTIKLRSKKKHLQTKFHKTYADCIIARYQIQNSEFLDTVKILRKHISDYSKKFIFFITRCQCKLIFDIDKTNVSIEPDIYKTHLLFEFRRYLLEKITSFEKKGYKFSHISEMKITFITNRRYMTYELYLQQTKSMLEWTLIKKLTSNPNLITNFQITSHPLIRKYSNMYLNFNDDVDLDELEHNIYFQAYL